MKPGQQVCPDPDFPSRCFAVDVKAGQPAPFTGDLFTPDLAIHLNQAKDHCETRVDAAVTATAAAFRADIAYNARVAAADKRVAEVERDAYKRASERPFIEHPAVVATITAAVLIATYFAVAATVKGGRSIVGEGVQ